AIADRPADSGGYRSLADVYHRLRREQEAYWDPGPPTAVAPWSLRVPPGGRVFAWKYNATASPWGLLARQTIRYVQQVIALNQALRVRPDEPDAHLALTDLYLEMNYPDAAHDHLARGRALLKAQGPQPGQEEAFERRLEDLDGRLQALTEEVKRRTAEY